MQDLNGRVWIGTEKGLYSWRDGVLRCAERSGSFQRARCLSGYVCFVTDDGDIWSTDSGKDSLIKVARLPGVVSGKDLPGNMAVRNQWVIFTRNGGFVYSADTRDLRPASVEWDIPGAEVFTDNRGNYWIYNKTGKLHYVLAETGVTKTFQLMPEERSVSLTVNDTTWYMIRAIFFGYLLMGTGFSRMICVKTACVTLRQTTNVLLWCSRMRCNM